MFHPLETSIAIHKHGIVQYVPFTKCRIIHGSCRKVSASLALPVCLPISSQLRQQGHKGFKSAKCTHVPPAALTQCTAVKHREVYDWDTATIYQRRHIIKLKSIFFFPSETDDNRSRKTKTHSLQQVKYFGDTHMKKIPAHLHLRTVGFIRPELLLFHCRRKTNKSLSTRLLSSQRRESLLPTARWSSAQLFFILYSQNFAGS